MAMTSYFKNYGHCSTLFRPLQEKFLKWRLFPLRRGKNDLGNGGHRQRDESARPSGGGAKVWVDRSEFLD